MTKLSNCCSSPMTTSIADEGTGVFVCTACNQACDIKVEQLKTIQEWAKQRGYIVLDPDGFDRSNPDLMVQEITEEEFDKGFLRCTIQKLPMKPQDQKPEWENELRKMFPVGYTIPKSMLGESGDHGLSTSFKEVQKFMVEQIQSAKDEARREAYDEIIHTLEVTPVSVFSDGAHSQGEVLGRILRMLFTKRKHL